MSITAHDVFVSYSQQDKAVADAVVARLEQDGSRCWIASRDILPGTSWGEAIVDAIAASRVMVVVMSGNTNRSRQVVREVERAVAGEVIIVPFRIEQVDPTGALAYFLAAEHWLDAITPPMERHIQRLSRTVQALLAHEPVAHEDLDKPPIALSRRRRSRRAVAFIAGLAAAVIGLLVVLVLTRGDGNQGSAPTTSGTPTTTVPAPTTTIATPEVGLEEVGRFKPIDLNPTDLMPPGAMTGFDIEEGRLVYANGIDGVTRMAIDEPAQPRAMATYGIPDAQNATFAGDLVAAISSGSGSLSVTLFSVDGSVGATVPIEADGATTLYNIVFSDGQLFVAGHDYFGIIDATVPDESAVVFEWTPPGATGNPADVFVSDGVAYVSAGWDGLYIFDVATPAAPRLLGHWASPSWVIHVVVVGSTAYLTLGDSGLAVLDVTDPADPRLLGTTTVPGFAGPVDVAHGHAFVGWFLADSSMGGVAVVDVTDPTAPTLVDTFGTFPDLNQLEVAGDHLFVSDETEGLIVFRISGIG